MNKLNYVIFSLTWLSCVSAVSNEVEVQPEDTENNDIPPPSLDSLHACQVFGDSHITTFDGKRYSVWGGSDCTYILALDCYFASWLVYVTFVNCGEASKSVSAVAIFKDNTVVTLSRGWQVSTGMRSSQVRMREGRSRHLGSGVFVSLFTDYLRVKFRDHAEREVTVTWDGWSTVTLHTEVEMVCGLCGNNNGNNADEFFNYWFHGSDQMKQASTFMSSWKVDQTKNCNAVEQIKSNKCSTPDVDQEAKRRCDALLGNPVFTTQCLAEDLKYYLEQCYVDLCYHMDLEEEYPTECQIASSLAELCEARGGDLRDWKERLGCPQQCSVRQAVFSTGCPLSYNPWRERCS
ncbi:hypothetical protein ACHWQZ_G012921 [Mnemiopsis leidyi]